MAYEGPILTAAEMRAAEQRAVDAGTSEATLMERAGRAAAEAIRRYTGGAPVLILCGPGNNGGDGYVIARRLAENGVTVRVAATGEAKAGAATEARAAWSGPVEAIEGVTPAPVLVDALFGTGLSRPLDGALSSSLLQLAAGARIRIAIDLPSGVETDSGAILSEVPDYDLTITFGAPKPAHFLQPAARHIGRLAVADIGVACSSKTCVLARPLLAAPGPDDHKYRRGYVAVQAGEMQGAAALAASAAARARAGYVRLIGEAPLPNVPHAVVQGGSAQDPRIGALIVGPGLGRGAGASSLLAQASVAHHPLILDADALRLLEAGPLSGDPVLTPHEGEFVRLFGAYDGDKLSAARAAAEKTHAVIVLKGADTIIAAPDGRAALAAPPAWLATAGTGDVLAGVIGAMRARGLSAFDAACAGVWLHSRAAELAGPGLIADDLLACLPQAAAECL